jgi:hypothetical protein
VTDQDPDARLDTVARLPDIAEFAEQGREPFRLWTAHGLNCALYVGFASLCGYVQLSDGHRWRTLDLSELDEHVSVHGGVTYAEDGWVGFDTGHAMDWWDRDNLAALGIGLPIDEAYDAAAARDPASRAALAAIRGARRGPESSRWTVDRITAETETLARQLAARTRAERDGVQPGLTGMLRRLLGG